jgi:hypothetical protein
MEKTLSQLPSDKAATMSNLNKLVADIKISKHADILILNQGRLFLNPILANLKTHSIF